MKRILVLSLTISLLLSFASICHAAGDATITKDFLVRAAEGLLPASTVHVVYSQKETEAADYMIVYPITGVTAFPQMTVASTIEVASSSSDDEGAVVTVDYIDSNWDAVEEDVTLLDQAEVECSKTAIRVNGIRMKTPKTGQITNAGEVAVAFGATWTSGVPDGGQLGIIRVGHGVGKTSIFSVPRNKVAIIDEFDMLLASSNTCAVALVKRDFGGAWTFEDHAMVKGGVPYSYKPRILVGAKGDFYAAVKGAVDSDAFTMKIVYHLKEE